MSSNAKERQREHLHALDKACACAPSSGNVGAGFGASVRSGCAGRAGNSWRASRGPGDTVAGSCGRMSAGRAARRDHASDTGRRRTGPAPRSPRQRQQQQRCVYASFVGVSNVKRNMK